MKIFILVLSLLNWTLVRAQAQSLGPYNSEDRSVEMTYEDLIQELSAKKKNLSPDAPSQILGFERVNAIFGYSFSSMDFNLASGGSTFSMSGIDVRANGQFEDSKWQVEAGLKNYGRVSNGSKSAESKILTMSLKNQDVLNSKLQYVAGLSSSFHLIDAKGSIRYRNELATSLNVTAGLRGPLSHQLSWGTEINTYSPISGKILKGGVEAIILLSSVL